MRLQRLAPAALIAVLAAQQPPVIRVTTRVVEVNVIVRDSRGPVAGLTRDDFALFDKGKPQKITGFTVTSLATTRKPAEPMPANLYTNRPEARGETPANATVVLLDGLNTPKG